MFRWEEWRLDALESYRLERRVPPTIGQTLAFWIPTALSLGGVLMIAWALSLGGMGSLSVILALFAVAEIIGAIYRANKAAVIAASLRQKGYETITWRDADMLRRHFRAPVLARLPHRDELVSTPLSIGDDEFRLVEEALLGIERVRLETS